MIDISSIIDDLFHESSEGIYFTPSLIFGYLYSLNGNLIHLWIAALWAVVLCTVGGMRDVEASAAFNQARKYLAIGLLLAYVFVIGPLAFLAALNNILPEQQELYPTQWVNADIPLGPFFNEIIHGSLATNDPTLLLLCFVQLAAHIYLYIGPFIGGMILIGIIEAVQAVSRWWS